MNKYFAQWSYPSTDKNGRETLKQAHSLIESEKMPDVEGYLSEYEPEKLKTFLEAHSVLIENRSAEMPKSYKSKHIFFTDVNDNNRSALVFYDDKDQVVMRLLGGRDNHVLVLPESFFQEDLIHVAKQFYLISHYSSEVADFNDSQSVEESVVAQLQQFSNLELPDDGYTSFGELGLANKILKSSAQLATEIAGVIYLKAPGEFGLLLLADLPKTALERKSITLLTPGSGPIDNEKHEN